VNLITDFKQHVVVVFDICSVVRSVSRVASYDIVDC